MKNYYHKDELAIIGDINEVFNVIPEEIIQTPFFRDKNGLPTSVREEAVDDIPFEHILYRLANTDEDFEIVFEKRFNKSKSTDRGRFLKRQIKAFRARKNELEQFNAELFDGELDLIERYIEYLKTKKTTITTPVRTLKEVPIEHQLPDNIYDLFTFVGIDLNLVMIKMIEIPFNHLENDIIFVQRVKMVTLNGIQEAETAAS